MRTPGAQEPRIQELKKNKKNQEAEIHVREPSSLLGRRSRKVGWPPLEKLDGVMIHRGAGPVDAGGGWSALPLRLHMIPGPRNAQDPELQDRP
eukprot:5893662-Pyramimonas_sp.AAC.1